MGAKIGKPFIPVWRTRGAAMRAEYLEFVRALGPQEELAVRQLMALSKLAARARTETAIHAWHQLGEKEILPAISKLKGMKRTVSQRQYYLSAETVAFGSRGAGRRALDTLIEAMKTDPDIAALARNLSDTQIVHARTIGGIEGFGRGSIALNPSAFAQTLPVFTARVPFHSKDLLPVTDYIVNNHEAIYSARSRSLTSYGGHLSWVQGNMFQPYVFRSRIWRKTAREEMDLLKSGVARSRGSWKPEELKGGVYLFREGGWKESVDWAVAATNDTRRQAYLNAAAQVKAAIESEAADQTLLDVVYREPDAMAPDASQRSYWPTMLRIVSAGGQKERIYQLIEPPGGITRRYVVNTAGAYMPGRDVAKLGKAGIQIKELQLEPPAAGMRALADAYILATLEVLFEMLGKDFNPKALPKL